MRSATLGHEMLIFMFKMGPLGGLFGGSWGFLGASYEPLGASWGLLGGLLELPGGVPGRSWAHFGRY